MSWTLTKKLDSFAGPGEIKRREMVLDPQESPGETKSREVELGSESWTSFASVVIQRLWLCSAQQLKQQLCGTLVATQWRGDTSLTFIFCCSGGGPRPPRSSGSERAVEPSLFLRPTHPSPSLISHIASVDVKQNSVFTNFHTMTLNTEHPGGPVVKFLSVVKDQCSYPKSYREPHWLKNCFEQWV